MFYINKNFLNPTIFNNAMKIKNQKLIILLNIFLSYVYIVLIKCSDKRYFNRRQNNNNIGKRIGIIAYHNDNNIGNQLLKYSMNFFLKKIGFNPVLVSLEELKNVNIDFLKKYLEIKEIKNYYTDLNQSDFDFLIVNSDQVWAYNYKRIFEVGFLSFAKNWNITKIVYAASLAYGNWILSKKSINFAKELVKQFSGISLREQNSIELINRYLGIKPILVLDPTFLIDKNDYLEIIKDFNNEIDINKEYLCSYILDKSFHKKAYIKKVISELKYKLITIRLGIKDFIQKFIFSINICKSIITDSYHGTVFSIIFNKPFITFINTKRGNVRFFSLKNIFKLDNRFIYPNRIKSIDIQMLRKNPNINKTNFNILKKRSIQFLKENLGLSG